MSGSVRKTAPPLFPRKQSAQAEYMKATAANTALLAWGKLMFNASSLTAIAADCDVRLRDEILVLNAILYAKNKSAWQGKRLWQAFNEHKARSKLNTLKDDALEPLYRL